MNLGINQLRDMVDDLAKPSGLVCWIDEHLGQQKRRIESRQSAFGLLLGMDREWDIFNPVGQGVPVIRCVSPYKISTVTITRK